MTRSNLLASSATIDGIQKLIVEFYQGTQVTLVENGADRWKPYRASNDMPILGVIVVRRRGRYRFELVV